MPARKAQRGATLVELIVFIVIVSVALAGVLSSLNVSVRGSADPLLSKQALAIAEGLLEEVKLKNYQNPSGGYVAACPTACERALFDDIGDYNGFTLTPVDGYTATVSVGAPNNDLGITARLITVSVLQPNQQTFSLSAYRANY